MRRVTADMGTLTVVAAVLTLQWLCPIPSVPDRSSNSGANSTARSRSSGLKQFFQHTKAAPSELRTSQSIVSEFRAGKRSSDQDELMGSLVREFLDKEGLDEEYIVECTTNVCKITGQPSNSSVFSKMVRDIRESLVEFEIGIDTMSVRASADSPSELYIGLVSTNPIQERGERALVDLMRGADSELQNCRTDSERVGLIRVSFAVDKLGRLALSTQRVGALSSRDETCVSTAIQHSQALRSYDWAGVNADLWELEIPFPRAP